MDCRGAQERLSEYQDGALDDAVAEGVSGHLRECGECASAARSLAGLRDLLRSLPPAPAPPELLARVRETVARENAVASSGARGTPAVPSKRPLLSRLRVPLEAAAAVLLVASVYWYQKEAPPALVSRPPPVPAGVASPASPGPENPRMPTGQEARIARRSDAAPPLPGEQKTLPAGAASGKGGVASLPPGAPEPRPRVWSQADLPAAPAVRASSEGARIVSESPVARVLPYGREVLLEVTPGGREGIEQRIAAAAWRLGGSVEQGDRGTPGDNAVVRVLLPEPAAADFLSEMERIGKVPPQGKPADVDLPAGPIPGTVAYTIRVKVR